MKLIIIATIFLTFASTVNSLNIPDISGITPRDGNPGYLKTSFRLGKANHSLIHPQKKRYVQEPIKYQEGYFFLIDLEVGSNKQPVTVAVDTGSSDFWTSPAPGGTPPFRVEGFYNPNTSTTSQKAPYDGNITYSYTVYLKYYYDQVTIPGGPTVSNTSVALSPGSDYGYGVLGLSGNHNEGLWATHPHDNFVSSLVTQGIIDKYAFSLYLEDREVNTGSVLFGGIDNAKYKGPLVELPNTYAPYLAVSPISLTTNENQSIPLSNVTVLDSGTTSFAFSNETVSLIQSALSYEDDGTPVCDQGDKFFYFQFEGLAIPIPYSEFVSPDEYSPSNSCELTYLDESHTPFDILGLSFLRHVYSVFNIDDNTISLAPVHYTNETNIEPII